MIAWLASLAAAQSLVIAPEVQIGYLRQPPNVPAIQTCTIFECETERVAELHYGASLIHESGVFAQVRRTDFINHAPNSRPYVLDARIGGWRNEDGWLETPWMPPEHLFVFGGVRYEHHFGDGTVTPGTYDIPLYNAILGQVGLTYYYTNDGFPDGLGGYSELIYLRNLASQAPRNDWPDRNGWVFRAGVVKGPLTLGMNVSATPGFGGFALAFEGGLRGGIGVL